ncbi:hypothetical protein ABB02_01054 [Clostridiaceae bacterium JG1575]|nr:hypothetical protein ABB02_01054 [Clostridiaceae bacterium JG1575]
MTQDHKGMLYMMIASTSFAFMATMVKLSGGGIPLFEQVFFRNFIMFFFAAGTLLRQRMRPTVPKEHRKTVFLRCFLGFCGVVCLFTASNLLPLADSQVLQKINPFFVILAAVVLLGERMTRVRLVSVLLGFLGAVIVINPTGAFDPLPALAGIGGAFFGGMAYVMIRTLSGRVPGMIIIFWFSVFSLLASLPLMLPSFVVPTPTQLVWLLLIGVFAASGQYFLTKAYLTAPASKVTLFDYTAVIVSPILGYFIFGEAFELHTLLGTLLILFSGLLAARQRA